MKKNSFKKVKDMKKVLKISAMVFIGAMMMGIGGYAMAMMSPNDDSRGTEVETQVTPEVSVGESTERASGEVSTPSLEAKTEQCEVSVAEDLPDDIRELLSAMRLEDLEKYHILDLLGKKLNEEQINSLACWLEKNPNVKKFNFGYCGLTDDDLIRLLQHNHSFTSIDLAHNRIKHDGIRFLLSSSSLENLNLSYSEIGDDEVATLSSYLKTNSILKKIDLKESKIGDKGVKALAEALKTNRTLKICNLIDCGITSEGRKILEEAQKENGNVLVIFERKLRFKFIADDDISPNDGLKIDKLYSLVEDNSADKKERIVKTFLSLAKELTYDLDVAREMQEKCHGSSWEEVFEADVKCTQERKRGACRQFSCRLIYELEKIGVKSYSIHILRRDDAKFAVVYKLGGRLLVADLEQEKINPSPFNPELHSCISLQYYYNVLKHGDINPLREMPCSIAESVKYISPIKFSAGSLAGAFAAMRSPKNNLTSLNSKLGSKINLALLRFNWDLVKRILENRLNRKDMYKGLIDMDVFKLAPKINLALLKSNWDVVKRMLEDGLNDKVRLKGSMVLNFVTKRKV